MFLLLKIPFHKSSKRRNHLKLDNLEKFFLLPAWKTPVKSVTSYQAEIKYLEEAQLQHSKVFFSIIGNLFFFKVNLYFFRRGYISRRESSSPKFEGGCSKRRGVGVWQIQSFFSGGVEKGASQKGVRSIFQCGADTLEDTMTDFWKVIYENVKRKTKEHSIHNKCIYIYGSQTF